MKKQLLVLGWLSVNLALFTLCSGEKTNQQAEKLQQSQSQVEEQVRVDEFEDGILNDQSNADEWEMPSLQEEEQNADFLSTTNEELLNKKDSLELLLRQNLALEQKIDERINYNAFAEDSLIKKSEVITGIMRGNESVNSSGMQNIDKKLSEIEAQQISLERAIELDHRKIDVAERKAGLLKDEIAVKEEEKKQGMRYGLSKEQLSELETEIISLESQIVTSSDMLSIAQNNISSNRMKLSMLTEQKNILQKDLEDIHETKGVVSKYVEAEKKNTEQDVTELRESSLLLVEEKAKAKKERELLQQQLLLLEDRIENQEFMARNDDDNGFEFVDDEAADSNIVQLRNASEEYQQYTTSLYNDVASEADAIDFEEQLFTEETKAWDLGKIRKISIIFGAFILLAFALLYLVGKVKKSKLSTIK